LDNPTRNTDAWKDPDSAGALFSSGRGRTRTRALWVQDAWRFAPGWLATIGGRYERWRASDGFNFNAGVGVVQPTQSAAAFSPKLAVQWNPAPGWRIDGSLAKAVRFATVGELYQLVSTGSTVVVPDANLKPETARSGELSFEHARGNGLLRLSLFQDNTRDALIAQTAFLAAAATPVSYTMNVGELRNRGLELVARRNDAWIDGLELSGSVTFVDSTILSNPDFASTSGTTSTGKHAPYVPRWRATAVATWRPNDDWAFTFAGRYSSRQYSTLDNIDNTAQVFGAFDRFLVFDARVRYRINDHFAAAMGIDNLGNEKYFLYHPFPQRTYVFDLEYEL
jgi:iron complex outermembrane receptor protein